MPPPSPRDLRPRSDSHDTQDTGDAELGEINIPDSTDASVPRSFVRKKDKLNTSNTSISSSNSTRRCNSEWHSAVSSHDGEDLKPPGTPSQIHLMSSMHSQVVNVVHHVQDYLHHMPKWQYRLLLCTVIILFVSLVLVLTVSVLYGFNMALPHIRVTNVRLALPPPHVDSAGHIPIVSTILFSNPNSFFTTSSLSPIRIYALPSRSSESLLALTAPRTIRLAGHEEGYSFDVNFTLKDVGSIDGGNATVAAVLEGQNCLLYTTSTSKITVKGLGLIPTSRNFKVECTVLRKWGENPLTLSDCYGRFYKG